jgi:hypothetical protein
MMLVVGSTIEFPGWVFRFLHFSAILSRHPTFLVQNVGLFLSDPESKKRVNWPTI